MCVIKNMKIGTVVYGIIYGKGSVTDIYDNSFYKFEVTYDNGYIIPYTIEGVPSWGLKHGLQTVFNVEDVNLLDYDISPNGDVMSMKKLAKCIKNDRLELRCPSGIWCDLKDVPSTLLEKYAMKGELHLFRRSSNVKNKK